MHLSQAKYAAEILDNAGMTAYKSATTPVDTSPKISASIGPPVADPTEYRSLVGALQYLTFTRPDIAYAVQQVCLHMHDLREQYLAAIKRILRYIKGTLFYGLQLYSSSLASMVTYTDADWAGCPDTRRSTSGFCVYLGDNLVSWSSKWQHTVSRSSAEAKYRAVANAVAEGTWIRQLLHELHRPSPQATVVFCDNVSVVHMSTNPVEHQRTKHIEVDLHFICDRVVMGQVCVLHVPSAQ
jgi:histone deacetylase 1/2